MSKLHGDSTSRSKVAVVFLLMVEMFASATRAQVGPSLNPQARKRMARAVDKTLQEGLRAKLPPHISTLLGLSKDEECPVMQGVVRTGKLVQGFDVSTINKNDVVLFVVSETTNDQTLYLTSKEGVLRKVVTVEKGVGRVQKITGEGRKEFEKEKQFWLDRLAPGNSRVGHRMFRILPDGVFVISDALPHVFFGTLVPEMAPLQIGLIGGGNDFAGGSQSPFLLGRQLNPDFSGNRLRYLAL